MFRYYSGTSHNSIRETGMPTAGDLNIEQDRLVLSEDWVLSHFSELRTKVCRAMATGDVERRSVDWAGVRQLDSAGASLIAELLGADRLAELAEADTDLSPERRELFLAVARAMSELGSDSPDKPSGLRHSLARVGRGISRFYHSQ